MKQKTFCGVFAFTFPDGSTTPFNRGLLSVLGDFFFELTFDEDFSHVCKIRKDFETIKKFGKKLNQMGQNGEVREVGEFREARSGVPLVIARPCKGRGNIAIKVSAVRTFTHCRTEAMKSPR